MRIGLTPLLAALSGFLCVAMGAFGAHAVSDPYAKSLIETGVQYNVLHTMAAIASVSFRSWGAGIARYAAWFFFAGIVAFSGSLYAMGMGMAPHAPIVMAAPVGGVLFLLGWIVLIIAGAQLAMKRSPS
ncbi:MAG: DUF423 domain-containing protein [Hydrogenophilaceae bacterium]|jgi:uncharacterized membrane protein YgdD (TMEM256/DUF423 family)|nr:DUF423 domain-containing protein [Hydrogenophilaceae bacterium]